MNKRAIEFCEYIKDQAPKHNKATVISEVCSKFSLTKDRSVYFCDHFAVRFSYSKTGSFSNTILSLSHLHKFDNKPFFVVLIRATKDNCIMLANSTFLSKISHSSQSLSIYNIKGSFNGSDIMKSYNGYNNSHENFIRLFAIHCGFDWIDNLVRLVEASSQIRPNLSKFIPDENEVANIYGSVYRSKEFIQSQNLSVLEEDLNERCNASREAILAAAHIENVNIRGRLIEALITASREEREKLLQEIKSLEESIPSYEAQNNLGDYCREFDNCTTITDIKTKILYLNSNPKAFNIDKFLKCMSLGNTIMMFYLVGIDDHGNIITKLCSAYHKELISGTIFQSHWAGRATRGVAQYNGEVLNKILLAEKFTNEIDTEISSNFIESMLAR